LAAVLQLAAVRTTRLPHFTVGVLLWPVVFVITDVINEYFIRRAIENYLGAERAAERKAHAAN